MPLPSTVVAPVCDMHRSASTKTPQATGGKLLPSFSQWRERLLAAEQGDGWLTGCVDDGRFLAVSRELVDALANELRRLAGNGPVLEICAGSGELAQSLTAAGVELDATDVDPPDGTNVLRLSADAAFHRFRPSLVLGTFVPFDAGVDEAVLACPTVKHYVVLNARIGGTLGSPSLWQASGWKAEPLGTVQPWMLTRHDVWMGELQHQPGCSRQVELSQHGDSVQQQGLSKVQQPGWSSGDLLQHGEAWLFNRTSVAPRDERACR